MLSAAIFSACFLAFPYIAKAQGIQSVIDSMFTNSAVSGATAFQTESRFGFSGGYAEIRTPIQSTNLVSFVPPNISGGCGGINLYLGSFSFINAQEFEQLIRDIGQDAIGYAFKLALENMCPSCNSVLDDLQDAMQKMNSALKNTCQLAEGVVSWANPEEDPNSGELAQDLNGAWNATTGAAKDAFSAFSGLTSNPSSATQVAAQQTSNPTTSPSLVGNPMIGNMTWKALQQGQAITILQGLGVSDNTSNEIMMSLIGTTIIEPEPGQQEAQNCSNSQTGCEGQSHPYTHTLSLSDIVNGPADTTPGGSGGYYLSCAAWTGSDGTYYPATGQALSCMSVTPLMLSSTGFLGIKAEVHALLFGGSYIGGNVTGVVPCIENGQGTSCFGQAEQNFINEIPAAIYQNLLMVQNDPSEVTSIAGSFEPYIVAMFAAQLGQAMITVAQSTFQGNPDVIPPADFSQTLGQLRDQVNYYTKEAQGFWQQEANVVAVIKAERAEMLPVNH